MKVLFEKKDNICIITINRPDVKNAIDRETASQLSNAFRRFEQDNELYVAVLCGDSGSFCAGADLKQIANNNLNRMETDMSMDGPLGPTRMHLSKPVIAAIQGYAVAGGLELALWCDLRVMESDAIFGVFCRRFGVPLVDGGTQRLPRLIGMSRALDLILTGRSVDAKEALEIGLTNRVVEPGMAIEEAVKLAKQIAAFPQHCLRSDREAVYRGFNLEFDNGMQLEFLLGNNVVNSGVTHKGAKEFSDGKGRNGKF
ncbi:crotonase/enoyl-CoA hydratase family protein [Bacillus sp. JJ722]|uniref:crotonase/enoyl-CoA hydratase family protein n=1 Tax=Bacillus sp. JJ722 TaxID=3122973 RepID=UPI002FFE73A4